MSHGWYRMHDAEPNGMIDLDPEEAAMWNGQGFGIFATVQRFDGARRKENLAHIRAWAIDMDGGDKPAQLARLELGCKGKPPPSSIVETKNGHHVYWYTRGVAHAEHYRAILDRLVALFGADKNALDLARVLRVPGYLHLKNPAEPFLVRHLAGFPRRSVAYDEGQMLACFPAVENEAREQHRASRPAAETDDLWEAIYALDCLEGLERLSGMGVVGGEHYTFRRVSSGNSNIVVDGKSSSCWVDTAGRIGSKTKGGPTLYQWLRWYGNTPSECVRALREIFPHLPGPGAKRS